MSRKPWLIAVSAAAVVAGGLAAAKAGDLLTTVTPGGPDAVIFKATDGARTVQARLTRQFENGTQVDLAYH